jgi:two-component system, OmpR family, phosphate regulon response regulator PhoB
MAHILIVEDDAHTARLLEVRLEQVGHTSAWIQDGTAALAGAREITPDLILLDFMMPGITGIDVAKKLKHDPITRRIPVIMLTARSEGLSVLAGLDAGADAYLIKPVHFPDLIRRIAQFLGRNARVA